MPDLPIAVERVIEVDDFQAERQYRADAAQKAKTLGGILRDAAVRLGPEHPDVVVARLDFFELFVDPEWEDFDSYTPEERQRVVACTDLLLRARPRSEREVAAGFALRLARIYFDVRHPEKGEPLARTGLASLKRAGDEMIKHMKRLGWTCYHTRQCLDISEECYRRAVAYLRDSERDYLDPLDCLQRVLIAEGRLSEAHTVAEEVRLLRARWEATRRQTFVSTLNGLRAKWDLQDRMRKPVPGRV
jgi:hypothetical protein